MARPPSWKLGLASVFALSYQAVSGQSATTCSGTRRIMNIADASMLAARCPTWTGNLAVQVQETIQLPFTSVTGSLEVSGSQIEPRPLITIDLRTLTSVGELTFGNLSLLEMPDLDSLAIATTLSFENIIFTSPTAYGYQAFGNMSFRNCRGLSSIETKMSAPTRNSSDAATFVAVGNTDLRAITLSYGAVNSDLSIQDNGRPLSVNLTNMRSASLQIGGLASFVADNLRFLGTDSGQISQAISNNFFSSMVLPSLESILGGTLTISRNSGLNNLSFPSLRIISGLVISDNIDLQSVDLHAVTSIESLSISGPADSISVSLANRPDVIVDPQQQYVCTSNSSIGSDYSCELSSSTSTATPPGIPSSSTPTSTEPPGQVAQPGANSAHVSHGLSKGANVGIGVAVGVGGLLALFGALCLIRRSRKSRSRSPRSSGAGEYDLTERKNSSRSPVRYSKVPVVSESLEDTGPPVLPRISHQAEHEWSEATAERDLPTHEGRVELEEQQGPRHEMDARSISDMEFANDEEETRSLQDIERVHHS